MPHRSPHGFWALCGLVVVAGCATSEGAAEPTPEAPGATAMPTPTKKRGAAPPAAAATNEDDDEDDDGKGNVERKPAVAAAPAPAPVASAAEPQRKTAADPFGDVGFKEVNEKDWLANIREKIAQQEKVAPTEVRLSPGMLRAAYVRSPAVVAPKPGRRAALRRHEIVVVDNQGRRVATFRAVAAAHGDEPPKDLRFLSDERLVYEVVEPPPAADAPAPKAVAAKGRRPAKRPASSGKRLVVAKSAKPAKPARALPVAVAPGPPPRTFVIQPIAARSRPIRCQGVHFTFSRERDRLAFVAGQPESGFVAVDGAQVYPRRGRTVVASAPAWSKDGHSLAFLEAHPAHPARLVLVAEIDNATGDTTWDLPPTVALDGALVFWAGTGKLVVGKTATRPLFAASFDKEMPGAR